MQTKYTLKDSLIFQVIPFSLSLSGSECFSMVCKAVLCLGLVCLLAHTAAAAKPKKRGKGGAPPRSAAAVAAAMAEAAAQADIEAARQV